MFAVRKLRDLAWWAATNELSGTEINGDVVLQYFAVANIYFTQ